MRRLLASLRRLPAAALACAAVAIANALVWALLTPPFQVPDENAHFAYTQYLAETGEPPRLDRPDRSGASSEELALINGLAFYAVVLGERNRPIWTDLRQQALEEALAGDPPRDDGGGASPAANNPPLYYALTAVPYRAASSAGVLDRLLAMRMVSVLLAGLTVLFSYLFLRELLPGRPWAWTAGALAVAFQPLFGFISSGVTNDSLLFATGAALLFAIARAFRRGLTPRRGAAIGAALGLGVISKATLLAFAPAAAFAVLWLAWRARADRRLALSGMGAAGAALALPVLVYVLLNLAVWDRAIWTGTAQFSAGTSEQLGPSASLGGQLSYIWQWYLPRLPFMIDHFPGGYYPLYEVWWKGFVGRLGWLNYGFTGWVYPWALVPAGLVLALAGTALWRHRAATLRRLPELAAYVLAAIGLVLVIGVAGYGANLSGSGFEQARYLLPLLGLYGALIALAAVGAGRRFGPAVGAGLVVLAMAHGVFAQLITIARYYG